MELWDLYRYDRQRTEQTMLRGSGQPEGLFRLVVHACIFNSSGEMLIQQRQPFKEGWPDLWDITAGGSVLSGEDSRTAAARELYEELGLVISFENLQPALTVYFDGGFDDIFLVERDVDLRDVSLQPEEVQAVQWCGKQEILQMIEDGSFIPYHKSLIELLFAMRGQRGAHAETVSEIMKKTGAAGK